MDTGTVSRLLACRMVRTQLPEPTDAWSSAMQYVDYVGARNYFEHPEKWALGVAWTPEDMAAVEGHPTPLNAITFTTAIPFSGEPTRSCPGVPREKVYDENTNPDGVRCTIQDYMRNVFGFDESGKAFRPLSNGSTCAVVPPVPAPISRTRRRCSGPSVEIACSTALRNSWFAASANGAS